MRVCIRREDQNIVLYWLLEKKFRPKHLEWLLENRSSSNARWDLFGSKDWHNAVNNKIKIAQATRDVIDALLKRKETDKSWGEGYSLFYVRALAHFFMGISITDKRKPQLINQILEKIKQLPQNSFLSSSLTKSCFFNF